MSSHLAMRLSLRLAALGLAAAPMALWVDHERCAAQRKAAMGRLAAAIWSHDQQTVLFISGKTDCCRDAVVLGWGRGGRDRPWTSMVGLALRARNPTALKTIIANCSDPSHRTAFPIVEGMLEYPDIESLAFLVRTGRFDLGSARQQAAFLDAAARTTAGRDLTPMARETLKSIKLLGHNLLEWMAEWRERH